MLSHRKKELLKQTIEHYIQTADPVSSHYLSTNLSTQVSPATIRNELKQLETQGYLSQLHTSSGRIPTDKGYRYYVDHLMHVQKLSNSQTKTVSGQLSTLQNTHNQAVQLASTMASFLNVITIVLEPVVEKQTIVAFHTIALDDNRLSCVLFNEQGVCWQTVMFLYGHGHSNTELNQLSNVLTQTLKHHSLKQLDDTLIKKLTLQWPQFRGVLQQLLNNISEHVQQKSQNREIALKGLPNLLGLPEFKQSEVVQTIFSALETHKLLIADLSENLETDSCKVVIGTENAEESFHACSLIVTPFSKEGQSQSGMLGVLGPTRMRYSFIMPFLTHVAKTVHNKG